MNSRFSELLKKKKKKKKDKTDFVLSISLITFIYV